MIYEFAVDLSNQKIEQFLSSLNLENSKYNGQNLIVNSNKSPSQLLQQIRSLKPAVLVGVGIEEGSITRNLGAAVCILEHFSGVSAGKWAQFDNKGLVRIIQTSPSDALLDLNLTKMVPNQVYSASVNEYGDISQGSASTGSPILDLGTVETDSKGNASLLVDFKANLNDWIGRSIVCKSSSNDSACGIVARSAGLFENIKKICSCSGKTIWQESIDDSLQSRL